MSTDAVSVVPKKRGRLSTYPQPPHFARLLELNLFNHFVSKLLTHSAGSAAGGDSRCNNDQVEQTAATAFLLVARGIDEPYATRRIGITDMGTTDAPWLAISATESQFGPNPLIELRTLYNVWREENLASTKSSPVTPVNPLTYAVVATIVFVLAIIARSWVKRKQS